MGCVGREGEVEGGWRGCEGEGHTWSMCRYIAAGYYCVRSAECGCAWELAVIQLTLGSTAVIV